MTDAASPAAEHVSQARSTAGSWALALLLASASFLVLFDSLAVATALPAIGDEFRLRPGVLQWVISLYSLSIGAFLVLGGRVCDVWGRRRVMLAGLAVCTGAGLLAGLAPNLPVLLAGRALQGVAAAFALPAALSAAAGEFETEPWRSRVFSVIAFAAWSAGLAGAMLGGVLTTRLGWRWVFLVTVPVGVLALLGARMLLPRDRPGRMSGQRLNVTSAVLVSSGLVVLLLGLQESSPLLGLAGLALLALMVVVERRSAHPMVSRGLLASRRRAGGYLAFGTYCAGYTALVVIGSQALQEKYGLSADAAGLALSPVLVAGAISSTVAPLLMRRFSGRTIVVTSMTLCALALTLIALSDSVPQLLPWLLLWGFGSGPIFVGLTRECISDAPEDDRGTASALFESMSHIGGAIAVAAFMTMLGAGIAFRPVELTGAVVVAAGALLTLLVVPGRRP
jgi:predicted MFS family arabinose efflux permease